MTAYVIPWQEAADFQFEVALDRIVYLMRARWNDYSKSWGLDISSRASTPLIMGIRVVANYDLLLGMNAPEYPPGMLVAIGEEPNYLSFLSGATDLTYIPEEVVRAL